MNRDDVIKTINKACLNATAEKIADAIMELQEKPKSVTIEQVDGHEFKVTVTGEGYGASVRVGEKCLKCGQSFLHYPPEKCKVSNKPEWEEKFDYQWIQPIKTGAADIKDFIRHEIIEKICEEIKQKRRLSTGYETTMDMVDIDAVKVRWLKGE